MTTHGVLSWGTYLPFHRLDRAAVTAALGSGSGKGTRTVASYDEDTTSMAVEAARRALRALPADAPVPTALYFATSNPAYLEKSNAAAVHAALSLDQTVVAYDMCGAVRSGVAALRAGLDRSESTLVVLSDIRAGLPGSIDESAHGDAAVAFVTGSGDGLAAEVVAMGGRTVELLDRWRIPGDRGTRTWEERFGEANLVGPATDALTDILKSAQLDISAIARLAVTGTSPRAARTVAAGAGVEPAVLVDDLSRTVGFTGTAHVGLMLASALEDAAAGDHVVSLSVADGADALILRATAQVAAGRPALTLRAQVDAGGPAVPYNTFLTWRGHLVREPPRRPDPNSPLAPAAQRAEGWKYGFTGSRCLECGRRHLPPQRVCLECRSMDRMELERVADDAGTIVTYTIDRLAFSLNPPIVVVAVDFDNGGRFQCELTDVDPDSVRIGQRVEMTFRRLFTTHQVHNYFWKARPLAGASTPDSEEN